VAAVTPRDWDAFSAQQVRSLGLNGAAQFFPWLLLGQEDTTPKRSWVCFARTAALGLPPPLAAAVDSRAPGPHKLRSFHSQANIGTTPTPHDQAAVILR